MRKTVGTATPVAPLRGIFARGEDIVWIDQGAHAMLVKLE